MIKAQSRGVMVAHKLLVPSSLCITNPDAICLFQLFAGTVAEVAASGSARSQAS
jgi:hypothetical protein